jgi:OmpA-OmpF porin, OOP family
VQQALQRPVEFTAKSGHSRTSPNRLVCRRHCHYAAGLGDGIVLPGDDWRPILQAVFKGDKMTTSRSHVLFTHYFLDRCCALVAMMAAATLVHAADVAGSKDPSFLKRYSGSQIVYYQTRSYDRYSRVDADPQNKNSWKWGQNPIEGQITRIVYQIPPGHTVLELLRNYESTLTEAGFALGFEIASGSSTGSLPWDFWAQGSSFTGQPFWGSIKDNAYISANRKKDGQDVTVAVYVFQYTAPKKIDFFAPGQFAADQIAVTVDVVTAKAVEIKMVEVKAADMADALATKGFINLYGIYFDTDKTEIKPESTAALDEVASLLKIDRSLKLEISGHTDNVGNKDHNAKLSEARAQAVMKALVTKYGIDAKRLTAKGYGDTKPVANNSAEDGRAKNRRVELRKL